MEVPTTIEGFGRSIFGRWFCHSRFCLVVRGSLSQTPSDYSKLESSPDLLHHHLELDLQIQSKAW